ncbi:proline dehydrogenase family protein [bacterium]|nr:proline dehydrogenase family protein [bacterium]
MSTTMATETKNPSKHNGKVASQPIKPKPRRPSPELPTFNLERLRVEESTRRFGREIFRRVRARESSGIGRERIEKELMRAMMHDEELKFRMLHFVDVYPALRDPKILAEHLEEYLSSTSFAHGGGTSLLSIARFLGRGRGFTQRPLAWASRKVIATMGKQFIAGENPRVVAPRIRNMEERGFMFSLDLLGEFVISDSQADAYAKRYKDMIENLGGLLGSWPEKSRRFKCGPRVNISIKLSSLTAKYDAMDIDGTAESVLSRVRPLLRAAKKSGAFVNIDMEKYEHRDMTLEIIKRLLSEEEFRGYENLGTVFQAYLRDAEDSARKFLAWIRENNQPITIRLVKGAYWDSEQIWARQKNWPVPVITEKRETDAMYERITRLLLENHDLVRTAIASHNVRSIAHALALRKEMKVPPSRFEIQMLFGMAGPIAEALRTMKLPVRIYVPCGELIPGMAYLVRRILENTSNESFLRQRFTEHVAENKLLADPKETE